MYLHKTCGTRQYAYAQLPRGIRCQFSHVPYLDAYDKIRIHPDVSDASYQMYPTKTHVVKIYKYIFVFRINIYSYIPYMYFPKIIVYHAKMHMLNMYSDLHILKYTFRFIAKQTQVSVAQYCCLYVSV